MRVIDLIRGEKPCLSFEVFPPKTSANYQSIQEATEKIAALGPDFISVTYGARRRNQRLYGFDLRSFAGKIPCAHFGTLKLHQFLA